MNNPDQPLLSELRLRDWAALLEAILNEEE